MENERIYEPKNCTANDLRDKSGVYQIRNLQNGKLYIGSTENLLTRKTAHFSALKGEYHRNSKLQKAYNKYGKENFIFEIIEFCEDKNKLIECEQYWMDRFDVCNIGYNIQPKAGKISITDEIRKKMSGKTPWNKGKNGIYSNETLELMRLNKMNVTGNKNPFYGKHHTEETKQKISEKNSIKVIRLRDGKIFSSFKQCATECDINRSLISRHCNNILKTKSQEYMYYEDWLKLNS